MEESEFRVNSGHIVREKTVREMFFFVFSIQHVGSF